MAIQKTTLVAEGKFIQNVEGLPEIERMIKALQTLQSLSKNNEMARYWGTQEDMINAVKEAYDKFSQSVRNGFSADSINKSALELVNTSNALKSIYKDFNFSEINSKFNSVISDAIKRTEGMRNIIKAEDFTSVLSPIQEAVNSLGAQVPGLETKFESAAAMAKQLFQSADSSRLRNELALSEAALISTQNELEASRIKLADYQNSDVGNLKSEISSLNSEINSLQVQKVEQFVTALRSLNALDIDQADNLLNGYSIETWDDIKGEYSSFLEFVNEAVNRLRSDPDYSVVDAISRAKQSVIGDGAEIDISAFDKVIQKIEQLESKLKESSSVMGGSEFSSGTERIKGLVDTLSASGGGSGPPPALDKWIEFLRSLDGLNFEEKIIPLQRLVNTMQQDVSVSSNSLQKVGEGLRAMTADLDTSKLAILKSLNFDSLSRLKISSTVKHLNEQLAPFSNSVNVGSLEAISKLNFDNLQNLKLSKSQMSALASFSNQTDLSSVISSMEQMASRIEVLFNKIGMSGEKAASDLVGSDAKIASSISKSTNQIDNLKMQFESLGLSDERIDEVVASLAKLRESYKEGTLTYEVYDEAIRKVRLSLKDLGETAKTTAKAQKEAAKEAEKAAKEAEDEAKKSQTLSQDPEKLDQYMTKFTALEANIRKQLSSWTKAKYGVSAEDYKNLEGTANKLGEIRQQLSGMTASGADAAFNSLSTSAKQFGNNIKIAGENTLTLGDRLGIAIKKYATFFTGMSAIMKIVQYGKQAVNAITEIDYSMNQLEIVTRETNAALNDYADNIIRVADTTAGSITDLIDATTTYARLGNSLEDSAILAELTQMLQNVGNIDASSAQNAITAILKAFDLQASDMEGILDRMVKVGNNFPISVSQLAEGLNNASSILAVATNYQEDSIESFEKSAAMLTAANTTVQNVSKSSTALRTIIARLRKMDTELDELGEVMTAAQYDELTQALTKQNVALTDETGQLRDAYDILLDMSEAWQKMTANERSALAQTFGSTRNQNVFISLMENFKEASDAMTAMQNSENELKNANDIYLDSIKAHIQQFKNAFETMFYSDGMVNFVNSIIDAGKSLLKLIEGITKVINFLGGLKTILPIVGGLLSNLITTKLISGVTKFISNIKNIGLIFSSLRTQVSSYAVSQNAANAAMNTGATAASALASALGMIGMALGAANLVVSIVNGIISFFKGLGNNNQENQISILSNSEIKETNSNLTDLYKQYIDLADKVSLTSEEQETLRGITEQLSDALGGEVGAIDFAKDSIDDYTQSVRDAVRAKQDLLIVDAVENMQEAEESLTNYVPVGSELRKNNTDLFNWLPGAKNGTNLSAFINFTKAENDEIERQVELLREAGYEVNAYYDGYAYALNFGYVDATNIDSVTTYINNLRGALLALSKTDISSGLYQTLKKELSFFDEFAKNYEESYETITEQIASEAFIDTLDSGIDTTKLEEFRDAVIKNAVSIVDNNSNVTMSTEEVVDAVDSLLKTIPELSALYNIQEDSSNVIKSTLSDIIDDIKKYSGENNVIELVFRPKADMSDLRAAGWDIQDGEDVNQLFTRTFSNKEDTVAINFTPVVVDEYGNIQTILSPKELEAYAKAVIDGTREDDLNLMIGTKFEMNDSGARAEAEKTRQNLESVLSTLDPDFDISNYENLVRTLTAVDTASNAATKALDNLNKKLKDPTYRQGMEARSDNFTKMMDLFDQGLIGDTDFQAYAEYYGLDLFKTVDGQEVAKTYEEISAELEALMPMVGAYYDESGKLATNAELAMINWLDAIDEAEDELINLDNAADGTFGDLISWNKETEELKFDPSILFDADKMELLESQFGISIEHFIDLLNEYRAHSLDWQSFSNEDLKTALESSKLLENVGDKAVLHVSQLEEMLTALGLDYDLIQDVVARAMQLSDIDIGFNYDGTETVGQVSSDIDGLIAQLEQAGYDADVQAAYIAEALSNVNPEIQAEVVANLDPELGEKVSAAIEDQNIEASVSTDVTTDVDDGLETIQSIWVNVDGQTLSFTVEANGLSDINDQLAALDERFGNSFDISAKPKQTAFLGEYAQYVSGGNNSDTPTYEIVMKYKLDDSEFKPAVDEAMEYIRRRFGEVDDVEVDLNGEKAVVSTDKLSDYIESQSPVEHVEADVSDAAETTSGFRRNEESKTIHIPVTITPEQVQTDIEFNQPIDGTPDYYDPGVFDTPVESYSVSPTADEQSLSQLTSDIEGAISDADADITLPSLSELPKVPEYKMEMEEVAKSVDGVSESFDNVSSSVSDLNSQNVDTSRKVAAIDGLSQAAEDASDSEHGLIDTSKELSNTGIDVSGKTGQLSNLSGSARSTAGNIRQTTNEWYALRNSPDTINKTITTTYKTVQVRQQAAKGTRHAKGGTTLLGDEYNASGRPRPELVISDGEAYIAGMDGPTLANLKPGDVVFTYEDTKKILSGSGISSKFPAFAGGTIDYEKIYKNVLSKTGGAAASYTDNSTNYNTYNYNAGSDSSSSETEEEFDWVDWIEVILDRAERAVADFKKIAESTYNSLKKRLSATGNEIKAITNEIGLQERAYQRYLQQANAVGLSADLAQLVRDGTIDIRQYDEETRSLISDYQNWYEKALSCADAVAELHENLASLYEDNFNNIQTDYENQIERMSFLTNEYNKVTSVIARTQNNTIPTLRKELGSLEEAFAQAMKSGEIEEQSEAWYAMIGVIQDVRDKISEAYEGIFSDIEKKYDHQLQSLEHFTNEYTNAMDQIEEKGRLASTRFYSALSDIEKQNINLMTAELKELEDALSNAIKSGEIEVYSEAWYSMREAIDDVKESIGEANLQLLKYETSMRELDWSYFDYTRDRVSKLNEEAEFLIDLLSSNNLYQDNGQLNGEGLATLGLRVQNYDVDMAEADAYAEEIKKINKDIANDPYNTKLIERRDELLKLQRDSILAAEDEKKAIKSLVEEGIKIELENLKELIDKYNDSLDSAKDLYEYNKNIAEQTKNISSLEKQLNAYQNDTSEETRARVQKLRVELDDARQKLEETQYDRFVSDSKKMLDNLYDEYSELLNSRLDDLDQLVMDMIDAVNKNSLDINSTIQSASEGVGYTTSNELNKIWNNANYVASFYGNDFSGKLTTVNETLSNIKTFVEALVKNSNKEAENSISGTSASTAATNTATTTGGTTRALTPSVTPSASASSASSQLSLSRNLSYGNTGDDVKQLQQKLYDLGYLNAAPDGIFGSYTLAAVNTFQMANGLTADGIVGQHTLAKLNGSPIKKQNAKTTTFSSSKNLSYNSHGSEVAQLQRRLAELGYYAGYIDGDFGSQTLQAVKDFQTANGIYADGIVGPVTIKALNGNPKLGKFMRYATGGLVTSTGFAQLDGTPQKPELVLNAEDTKNFIALKDILSDISSPLKLASMSGFSHLIGGQMGAGIGNVINGGININIDRVEDYNDFVNQLRQDHQFEKLIQSMTTDRMVGRSSLMKNNYRW